MWQVLRPRAWSAGMLTAAVALVWLRAVPNVFPAVLLLFIATGLVAVLVWLLVWLLVRAVRAMRSGRGLDGAGNAMHGVVVLGFTAIILVAHPLWKSREMHESQARGARIVELLAAYQARTGHYPQTLDAIPEAAALKPAQAGWRFEYCPNGDGFYLAMLPPRDGGDWVWRGRGTDSCWNGWCGDDSEY